MSGSTVVDNRGRTATPTEAPTPPTRPDVERRRMSPMEAKLVELLEGHLLDVRAELKDLKASDANREERIVRALESNTTAMQRLAESAPPRWVHSLAGPAVILGAMALLAFAMAVVGESRGADTRAAGDAVKSAIPAAPAVP